MDAFKIELEHNSADNIIRVWPSSWATGHPVRKFWRGITCQAILKNAIAHVNIIIGAYPEMYGRPFGPDADRRKEVIDSHEQSAQVLVEEYLTKRLPGFRIADGEIWTGISGEGLHPVYWQNFKHIYDETNGEEWK